MLRRPITPLGPPFPMREFAEKFYKSKQWQKCRDGFTASKRGLCEECLKQGIYKPGVIVHHKAPLTLENINDPTVTMNWDNLELLCRDHHALAHKPEKRYRVDELGRIISIGV